MSDDKTEIKIMSKMSKKRLQKDIVDIIKNPLCDNGIYYAHDTPHRTLAGPVP